MKSFDFLIHLHSADKTSFITFFIECSYLADLCPKAPPSRLIYLISSTAISPGLHRHPSLRKFHYWDLFRAIRRLCSKFPRKWMKKPIIIFIREKNREIKKKPWKFRFSNTHAAVWFHAMCVELKQNYNRQADVNELQRDLQQTHKTSTSTHTALNELWKFRK